VVVNWAVAAHYTEDIVEWMDMVLVHMRVRCDLGYRELDIRYYEDNRNPVAMLLGLLSF
jgi:hypothetical protein